MGRLSMAEESVKEGSIIIGSRVSNPHFVNFEEFEGLVVIGWLKNDREILDFGF